MLDVFFDACLIKKATPIHEKRNCSLSDVLSKKISVDDGYTMIDDKYIVEKHNDACEVVWPIANAMSCSNEPKYLYTMVPGAMSASAAIQSQTYSSMLPFYCSFELNRMASMSEFMKRYDSDKDSCLFVICKGMFVGSLIVDHCCDEKDAAEIRWFIVAKEFRGKGVGKRLFELGFEEAKKKHDRIVMHTVEELLEASKIYELFGFQIESVKEGHHCGGVKMKEIKYVWESKKK